MKVLSFFFFFFVSISLCFSVETAVTVNSEESRVIIHSLTDIDFVEFRSITIHSKEGNEYAKLVFFENEIADLSYADVVVISASGHIVGNYSKRDFSRESVIRGFAYYENQVRYDLNCAQNSFPYTIEVSSLTISSSMFDITHRFIEDKKVRTRSSIFSVEYPSDMLVERILTHADLIKVDSLGDNKTHRFSYSVDSLSKRNYQPYKRQDDTPRVQIIPKVYNYGGLEGSFSSWSAYGLWVYNLWYGRADLPKGAKEELNQLLADNHSDLAKATAIYKYVQEKMRYVYVGYGNGGIQTMKAQDTYKLGYGDCKSLTNFTNAAMTYAGIESYPALVEAGANHTYFDTDIPQDPFNHVILVLPTIEDTTWLECTSKNYPFGYISNFTDDRNALIIKPSGGQLASTPSYSKTDNQCERYFGIDLHSDGSANIHFEGTFTNLAMKKTIFYNKENSSVKAIDVVKREMSLASFDLLNYESACFPNDQTQLNVSLDVNARLFARRVGKKLMVKPFINNQFIPSMDSTESRTVPIYFKRGYTVVDSVKLNVPIGHVLTDMPESIFEESEYGLLNISFSANHEKSEFWIHRKIVLKKGEFPVEEYLSICRFYQKIEESDDVYLILQKE